MVFWCALGRSWAVLGALGAVLGGLERILGRSWGRLVGTLGRLEATLRRTHVSIDADVDFTSFLHALAHTRWVPKKVREFQGSALWFQGAAVTSAQRGPP